jgi:hypothetical protein
MGSSPSCLNGIAEELRLQQLHVLLRQAHSKMNNLSVDANAQGLNSPAWAQFLAWTDYSRRLQEEEGALLHRLGTCVTLVLCCCFRRVKCLPLKEAWLVAFDLV